MPLLPSEKKRSKKCCHCKETKTAESFHTRRVARDGLSTICKQCYKVYRKEWKSKNKGKVREMERRRKKKKIENGDVHYSILRRLCRSRNRAKRFGHVGCTAAVDELVPLFSTTCQSCGRSGLAICLDHCHKTGKFRGFICKGCNTILGHAEDCPEILKRILLYLEGQGESL